MLSRRFATIVTLVIVAAFVVVSVAPAFAAAPAGAAVLPLHAQLTGSTPADGSTVKSATAVTLEFNEDINPDFVVVKVAGATGNEADGKPTTAKGKVTQPLVADLAAGKHVVTYRVVSTDGHPVSGRVTFRTSLGPATATPSPTASASAPASPTTSAPATSAPAPSASTVASPQPTVTTTPASQDSGGVTPYLVIGAVVLLAALGLGAAWRTFGGPKADAEQDGRMDADEDAGDVADGASGTDADPAPRAPTPPA